MSEPVFHYFPIQGRGEIVRYVLAAGNISYKEVNEVATYKEDSPFGSLPYAEIEGKRYGQSNAIAKYFAKKAGFLGTNDLEELEIVSYADFIILDCLEASLGEFIPLFMNKDTTEDQFNELRASTLKKFTSKMETLEKVAKGEFLLGDKMTYADIALAYAFIWSEILLPKDSKSSFSSKINGIIDKVNEQEGIKEYISKRSIPLVPKS